MLRDLGRRANVARTERLLSIDPAWVAVKLGEEAGETLRAVLGRLEGREGRGDVGQECAQVVIVAAALLDIMDPDADLGVLVAAELARLETA